MKFFLIVALLSLPILVKGQNSEKKTEPFKGASKIIAEYTISGDSLYLKICKDLVHAGYTIDKREPDLLLITTEDRPVKQLNYKMRLEIRDNRMMVNGQWISGIGFQIGGAKTEQTRELVKYTSKMFVTRNVFEEMITFVKDTGPESITYDK